ncbi:MAG TPA: hypothetical protein VIK60_00600 [Vicinamibacterales bacterium]
MARAVIVALGCLLAAGPALAHHGPSVLGTVRITQPVLAGGEVIEPGTYEVRLTGEHVKPLPGQSEDAEQRVELVANGRVVARDVAEVMPASSTPVGTSGGAVTPSRVERLKADDFLRASMIRGGERYLIYLPLAK